MTTLSRRRFLKGAIALGAGAVLYRYSGGWKIMLAAGPEVRQLRLIHTNDHHSRIEPATGITIRAGSASGARNLGGVSRRRTIFDQIRADTSWTSNATYQQDKIFVDAGDIFQGTLYFNAWRGEADHYFYNNLGYDAVTIGNHEFDLGDQALADFIRGVGYPNSTTTSFPIVSANITASGSSPLAPLFEGDLWSTPGRWARAVVRTLPSGERVGIIGLTTAETPNIASPSRDVAFGADYASIIQPLINTLRGAPNNCRTVICLSHIGYEGDRALAAAVRGLNIIVGGHSHTPLLPEGASLIPGATPVAAYPQLVRDLDNENVVIVQDWEWGKWIGDLIIGFDADGRVSSVGSASRVIPVWANDVPSSRSPLPGEPPTAIAPFAAFETAITSTFKPRIDALNNQIFGASLVELPSADVRARETALGNLIADAFRERIIRAGGNPAGVPIVAIINGGGIRTSLPAGSLTVGRLREVMPFGNTLCYVDLTGAQLKAALENGYSALRPGAALGADRNPVGTGRFAQVSGLRVVVDVSGDAAQPPQPATSTQPAIPARRGTRVRSVEVQVGDRFEPLDPARTYRVVTNSFMWNGGDGYSVFTAAGDLADPSVGGGRNRFNTFLIDADVVQEYIEAQPNKTVNPRVDGRLSVRYTVRLPVLTNAAALRRTDFSDAAD
ncbi:MAG: 5'-nucleotidase C-terminal domain-containing protein [Oscillochloridaceae bacterium]|nr:5'-nucleotidase C-terminal domain-containing protein [Chloroflexaceae bacterium]MDW8389522.1 5'-nucleotidase C-terminal domain-containing protein [Oscillochloridaceae bacterium]